MNENNTIFKGDRFLWGVYFVLCIISIIEVYSSSSFLTRRGGDFLGPAMRQISFVLAGTALVVVMHNFHYKWCKLLMLLLTPVSFGLMIWVDIFGSNVNDASRWLNIFGVSIQPSELAKLSTIITLAFILARFRYKDTGKVTPDAFKWSLIVVAVFSFLIFVDNFSTSVLLALVGFCMMMVAGVETKKLAILAAAVIVALAIIVPVSVKMYQYEQTEKKPFPVLGDSRLTTVGARTMRFVENFGKPAYQEKIGKDNYQPQHAYMAVANGGVFGVFPGNSRERDFLPQAFSDFIYAIIVEEMGMVGGIFVMLLYMSMLLRAGVIARRCEKAYPAFLITGLAMMIAFQALINMGVSVGLFPVTGQPLPLVSRGGTSFLITSAYFGIMLSVSRYARQAGKNEQIKEPLAEESGDISAPNPAQI